LIAEENLVRAYAGALILQAVVEELNTMTATPHSLSVAFHKKCSQEFQVGMPARGASRQYSAESVGRVFEVLVRGLRGQGPSISRKRRKGSQRNGLFCTREDAERDSILGFRSKTRE